MNTDYHDSAMTDARMGPRSLLDDESPKLIVQADGTKICGPCCVAMALDAYPDQVMRKMRSIGGGTRTSQLIKAMREYYDVPDRLEKAHGRDLPDRAILKLTIEGQKSGHWALLWHAFIYDPGWGAFHVDNWLESVLTHTRARITSFLRIEEL